jgi:hypothetical protein
VLDSAHRPRISEALLRQIAERGERRPVGLAPRNSDAVELSRRLRSMPPANLRRRLYPS